MNCMYVSLAVLLLINVLYIANILETPNLIYKFAMDCLIMFPHTDQLPESNYKIILPLYHTERNNAGVKLISLYLTSTRCKNSFYIAPNYRNKYIVGNR